eukprot:1455826-Alexandrium_andersonii.AAC.1
MSASLVGSEMCIRDSSLARLIGSSEPLCQQSTSLLPDPLRLCSLGCYPPVSYTHLTLPTICSV